ncbi:TPA: HU family DNA-binding protein [Bacillus cereus]|nr:HU family DNA-binding protein [Bacillus cereus]
MYIFIINRCLINKSELTKPQTILAVGAVFQSIQNGDNVQLIGFGTFEVRQRSAREGRNPHTDEALTIPKS